MVLDAAGIQRVLPHRFPFLMVDRVLELEPGQRAVALKNVSGGEPFFQGHFPGHPVMPGVLILEALAQTAAFAVLGPDSEEGALGYLTGVDNFRFRQAVYPGDQLRLEAELERFRRGMGKARVQALVEGKVVTSGLVSFAVLSPDRHSVLGNSP